MLCDATAGESQNQSHDPHSSLHSSTTPYAATAKRRRQGTSTVCTVPSLIRYAFSSDCIRAIVYAGDCYGYNQEFVWVTTGSTAFDALLQGENCATAKAKFRKSCRSSLTPSSLLCGHEFRAVADQARSTFTAAAAGSTCCNLYY